MLCMPCALCVLHMPHYLPVPCLRSPSTHPRLAPAHSRQVCKGFPSAKEGLLLSARFLLAQFEALDSASGHKALKFMETDFGRSLAKEVRWLAGAAGSPRCMPRCPPENRAACCRGCLPASCA